MTEIPEHLLKRSRERRAQLKGGGDEETSTPAASTEAAPSVAATPAAPMASGPAPRAAAASAPAAPPPPEPDPPVVEAAKRRRKMPFWAAAAVALLPVWGYMYARAMTEPAEAATDPVGLGADVYSGTCASCHAADGSGGSAQPLADGEARLTFPHIEDQIRFVYYGTDGYNLEGIAEYGDPNREGGSHQTGSVGVMPSQGGAIPDVEILEAVCYIRFGMDDIDPEDEEYAAEYDAWCSEDSPIVAALDSGEAELPTLHEQEFETIDGEPVEIMDGGIGEAPRAGTPAA